MQPAPRGFAIARWLVPALLAAAAARADEATPTPRATSTVGMQARIDQVVLPGPELEAKPIEDRRAPVVVRIAASYAHGSAFRYDIVYYGLEPGRYDLKDYLRRKDGKPLGDIPSIPVEVRPILPPGQVEPHRLVIERPPALGGYRFWVVVGGIAWVVGLVLIALVGRRRRADATISEVRPVTLADRLRPLVEGAMTGALDANRRAELERLLIGYWRRRLGLEDLPPGRCMALLRDHDEAGPLFRRLEDWLHRPPGSAATVDVAALLAPYRDIPADEANDDATAASGPAARSERPA